MIEPLFASCYYENHWEIIGIALEGIGKIKYTSQLASFAIIACNWIAIGRYISRKIT